MKQKKIIFILIGILVIVLVYFGYKIINLYNYDIGNIKVDNYGNYIDGLKISDIFCIKNKKSDEVQYLTFKDMKIRNDFVNFEKLENQVSDDVIKYVVHDNNGNIKASFWMGQSDTYVNLLKKDAMVFGVKNNKIKDIDLIEFLEENNINDDIELFRYLEKNKFNKNNIFTSVKKMKENYKTYFMVSIIMPLIKDITLIDGDYMGYILNLANDGKEISILKNDKRYIFTFIKLDYFTDDYIKELLSTIEIE